MDPITLATVTTAVTTLAMDAGKDIASDVIKQAWGRVKGWLGWTKEPAVEDLAAAIAGALKSNTAAFEKIVAELKTSDTGTASRLASKVNISITNTTGNMTAGRDNLNLQGSDVKVGGDAKFGGA